MDYVNNECDAELYLLVSAHSYTELGLFAHAGY